MKTKFSYSQILLSIAIGYLAYALLSFTKEIPGFIDAVDRATPHISSIVTEVELVRIEVGKVRALVDEQIPAILMQVDRAVPLVEQGLMQSEQYSQELPQLWQHLEKIETQIQLLQKSLPDVLQRVDAVVETTNATTLEVSQWRPHSTQYLTEIKHSREDIPQYLSRAEAIIIDAKTIGKEASSGLVSGFLQGVISLPFDVVAGLTGIVDAKSLSAQYLTEQDIIIMQEQVLLLLANNNKQQAFWHNNDSGNRGKISKKPRFTQNGLPCHKLTFVNHFKDQQETLNELMCQDKQDLWQVM
jgi:regulator of replication initiation timing